MIGIYNFSFRFCRRHIQFITPNEAIKPRLPDHLQERMSTYLSQLHNLTEKKYIHEQSNIACMDELFLHLTPSAVKEQKHCNSTTGLSKNTGYPGATAVIYLCTTGDGILLPPLLVAKVFN